MPDKPKKPKARKAKKRAAKVAKTPKPSPAAANEKSAQPKAVEVPREFATTPKKVSDEGLVHMDASEVEKLKRVPLYYSGGKWYGPNRQGGYSPYKDSQAAALVAEYGFHRSAKTDWGTTQSDRALLWLMQNNNVWYAGPLAGWPTGAHQMGPDRVLVTDQIRLIEPKAGPCESILRFICSLLLLECEGYKPKHQADVFFIWLSKSVKELYARMAAPGKRTFQHCPALAIFGEKHCGKSALLDLIIKPIFGDKMGDPSSFLLEKRFNADLIESALLIMDDKGASNNLEERRERGDNIKSMIWKEDQRMEGKNTNAQVVRPFRRLVIGGNLESSSLNVMPTLNDSLRDKLGILKAIKAEGLPTDEASKAAWAAELAAELPAFVHWLLSYQTPKRLHSQLDPRTGVLNFWHPEITAALLEKQPECKALEVIAEMFKDGWKGTSTEFYKAQRSKDEEGHFAGVFATIDKCGRLLSELAKSNPERVRRAMHGNVSHYEILPLKKPEL